MKEPQEYTEVLSQVHFNNISEVSVDSLGMSFLLQDWRGFDQLPNFLQLLIFAFHIFLIYYELAPRSSAPTTGIKKPI